MTVDQPGNGRRAGRVNHHIACSDLVGRQRADLGDHAVIQQDSVAPTKRRFQLAGDDDANVDNSRAQAVLLLPQPILADDVLCREAADPCIEPTPVCQADDERYFVGRGRVRWQGNRHAIIVGPDVERILVGERNIDRAARGGKLGE
jgi:hypothetical protein